MKYVSANVCPLLPEGCFDVEEGYYDPEDKVRAGGAGHTYSAYQSEARLMYSTRSMSTIVMCNNNPPHTGYI
jgi:hypothetical protein